MTLRQHTQKMFARQLFSNYLPQFVISSSNLPGSAEVTKLKSKDGRSLLLCIVNYQDELPNIPLYDVTISFNAGFVPSSIRRVSDGKICDFLIDGTIVTLKAEKIEDGEFFEIIR